MQPFDPDPLRDRRHFDNVHLFYSTCTKRSPFFYFEPPPPGMFVDAREKSKDAGPDPAVLVGFGY